MKLHLTCRKSSLHLPLQPPSAQGRFDQLDNPLFGKQAQGLSQNCPIVGRVTFASGEQIEYTDPAEFIKAVQEELPYHATTGFRYETLTNDPEVRKAVDDALYNLFGEENPRRLEDYHEQPDEGMKMQFGGM